MAGTLQGFGERGWSNSAESADLLVAAPLSHGSNPNSNMEGIQQGASVRRLTPTEAERLQALPDGWTRVPDSAPDSRRYAGLGDAVTASVGEWLGHRILAADKETA